MAIGYGRPIPKPSSRVADRIAYKGEREQDLRNARRAVWLRDEFKCRACGRWVQKRATDMVQAGEVHHIVPRSRLHKHRHAETSNLVLLCKGCHADAQAYRLFFRGNANGSLVIDRRDQ